MYLFFNFEMSDREVDYNDPYPIFLKMLCFHFRKVDG